MLILDTAIEDILNAALDTVIRIGIAINSMIYNFASFLFDIFITIIEARVFTSNDYQQIANSIYLVIGVVALFIVAYALLRAIIDPDQAAKANYSPKKIIPNILIAIVLIALVPTVFNTAFDLQNAVLKTNVIPNIIFGRDLSGFSSGGDSELCNTETGENCSAKLYVQKTGRMMTNSIFEAFFVPTDLEVGEGENYTDKLEEYYRSITIQNCILFFCKSDSEVSFYDAEQDVSAGKKGFGYYGEFAGFMHGKGETNKIEYNFLLQLISGCLLVYVLVNFCIDMAVRAIKLGYFQIMAPIPILTIMLPGQKKIFDNWLKNTLSTFLDVFIRVAIIFLGVLLINQLQNYNDELWTGSMSAPAHPVWAKAFLMIGILIFMKQAPKLLADIFGISSGSFKLGIKDKLGEMAFVGDKTKEVLSSAQGATSGALGAGWTAKKNGMKWTQGAAYGWSQGWSKGAHNPHQFNAMRQGFYEKVMQGEGKASFWGKGRAWWDNTAAGIEKEAKNAYKDLNFKRVLQYQQRGDWKDAYNAAMNSAMEANQKQQGANRDAQTKIVQEYAEDTIRTMQERYNNTSSGDYHNEELQKAIRNLTAKMGDANALNDELVKHGVRVHNDSRYMAYEQQNESLAEELRKLGNERNFIVGDGTYKTKDDKIIHRGDYDAEKEFFIDSGGYSDILRTVDAYYKEGSARLGIDPHPDFKDVYDTHIKNLTKEEVDKYINSAEGRKAIAVREIAEKNLGGGGGAAAAAPKSGDKK